MKQTEILTHATHVNGWFPAVYMSCMSQNFRLFHVSNLSVRNFRIFPLMYTGSLIRATPAARHANVNTLSSSLTAQVNRLARRFRDLMKINRALLHSYRKESHFTIELISLSGAFCSVCGRRNNVTMAAFYVQYTAHDAYLLSCVF